MNPKVTELSLWGGNRMKLYLHTVGTNVFKPDFFFHCFLFIPLQNSVSCLGEVVPGLVKEKWTGSGGERKTHSASSWLNNEGWQWRLKLTTPNLSVSLFPHLPHPGLDSRSCCCRLCHFPCTGNIYTRGFWPMIWWASFVRARKPVYTCGCYFQVAFVSWFWFPLRSKCNSAWSCTSWCRHEGTDPSRVQQLALGLWLWKWILGQPVIRGWGKGRMYFFLLFLEIHSMIVGFLKSPN